MKIISSLFLVCLLSASVQAQPSIVVSEILEYMSKGEKTGFETAIVEADPQDVASHWKSYIKKYKGKVKKSKGSAEIFADNVMIPGVSENTVDIYSTSTMAAYGTRFTAFVDLGGSFISSSEHEIAFGAFRKFLEGFVRMETERILSAEIEQQQKVAKSLNKELSSMVKKMDGFKKDIEKSKKELEQLEQALQENTRARTNLEARIAIQKEIIITIKEKRTTLRP